MKDKNKIERFELRTTPDERSKISHLAKRLKVKSESEAVRRAIAIALQATSPQHDQSHRQMAPTS